MLGQTFIPNSLFQTKVEASPSTTHEGKHDSLADVTDDGIPKGNCVNTGNNVSVGNGVNVGAENIETAETSVAARRRTLSSGTRLSIGSGNIADVNLTEIGETDGSLEASGDCERYRMRDDLDICVCNPVTDKYTTYEIKIQTVNPAFNLNCSHTRRRYNDFCWLRKTLKEHHPMCNCPDLPAKKNFSQRFEPQFIVERMKSLEDWIFSLLEVDLFLSDTTVHLFLQTNLSCNQIASYVNGRLSSAIVRQGFKACKLKTENSLMRGMTKESQDPSDKYSKEAVSVDSDTNSDNDSSYESQKGYSSSSETSTGFSPSRDILNKPPQIIYSQSVSSDYSVNESCASSSLTSNHFDDNGLSKMSIGSNSVTDKSNRTVLRQTSTPPKEVHRVENGVIFSVNSI